MAEQVKNMGVEQMISCMGHDYMIDNNELDKMEFIPLTLNEQAIQSRCPNPRVELSATSCPH